MKFALSAEFLSFYALPGFCHLFSQGWPVKLKFMASPWPTGFLHTLSSHLSEFMLSVTIKSSHRELATGWEWARSM